MQRAKITGYSLLVAVIMMIAGKVSGQNVATAGSVPEDSLNSYLKYVDRQNMAIATAFNEINSGLKAKTADTLINALFHYRNVVESVLHDAEVQPVENQLLGLHQAYIAWIRAIFDNNSIHLMELEILDNNKRALQLNADGAQEPDTRYADQAISDFFKQMDDIQEAPRNNFSVALQRLKEELKSQRK